VKYLVAILLLIPALAWGKPKPEEYTVAVHVQSSRLITICYELEVAIAGRIHCDKKQHLDVLINGAKFEMLSGDYPDFALKIGDYKAKLLPDDFGEGENQPKSYEYHQKYEFLFPDGKTRKYVVVGATE
jgi:hypothetical protein